MIKVRDKMGFSLQDIEYLKIKSLFSNYPTLLTKDFENRIKKAISVLHFYYLWGSCREARIVLEKSSYQKVDNLFSLIMKLYAKKRQSHQANFLLLHCFENALRSTLAVKIANLYNHTCDDWFLRYNSSNEAGLKSLLKIFNMRKKHLDEIPKSTWEIFDCFYLVDLEDIIESHWGKLSSLFKDKKTYKNQILPSYGTKEHLLTKISQIRKARNEVFRNKPTKIKFQKDLEVLLLRLEYNLQDAIQVGELSSAIKLHYNYE